MALTSPTAVVDEVTAARVARPTDLAELATLLAAGEEAAEAIVFRTNGTKLDWGRPPARLDTVVDMSGLGKEVAHAAGDLVVRVSAAVGLAELNHELARAGQRLAVDEVVPGSTIGGIVATGLSGPLRFGFGAVRDLLIGITVVRADGTVARSGGAVVKNVAGYDLGKLFTGSFGTLGAITEAHFRLHPLPATRRILTARHDAPAAAGAAVRRIAASPIAPSAVELAREGRQPFALTVLLEGGEQSVAARARRLGELGAGDFIEAPAPPAGFGSLPGEAALKCTFAPGALAQLLGELENLLPRDAHLSGSAAIGLLYLGVPAATDLAALLDAARGAATRAGGGAIVLRAPLPARAALDLYGPLPAPELQRAVKASFDPSGRLAPGRFVTAP